MPAREIKRYIIISLDVTYENQNYKHISEEK